MVNPLEYKKKGWYSTMKGMTILFDQKVSPWGLRGMKIDLDTYQALLEAPATFWAADLTTIDEGVRGGIINGWRHKGWIEPTGETRESQYQVNETTIKIGQVKQWRKCPETDTRLSALLAYARGIYSLYKDWNGGD